MKTKSRIVSFLLVIILVLFFVFFIIPLVYGIFISFTDWDGIAKEYEIIGIDNYVKMFKDERFQKSSFVTIKYATILLTFSLILGYISAKVINRLPCFRSQALFVSFLPYMITPVITCIIWNQMYIGLFPEIGKLCEISILKTNLLANKELALWAVSFVDLWMLIPYSMILFNAALNSIPVELIESAQLEGANSRQVAFHIELPHILPAIGMITTVILARALTNIDSIMILTSGGPLRSTETLYYTIYKNSTEELHYAYGLAEGIVVSVVSIIIYLIINKFIVGRYANDITYNGGED